MAFGNFMNMEKLSLTIAENHIAQMTDGTYDADDCSLDMERLTGNIENGFVAITQLSCYFESFLNTIISTCMHYDGEVLLKCSGQRPCQTHGCREGFRRVDAHLVAERW